MQVKSFYVERNFWDSLLNNKKGHG